MKFFELALRKIAHLENIGGKVVHKDDKLVIVQKGHRYAHIDRIGGVEWNYKMVIEPRGS